MSYLTTMWEAIAAPGRLAELTDWAVGSVAAGLHVADPACRIQIFHSADQRLVIIATGSVQAPVIPSAPENLCQQSPHQWQFQALG